MEQREEQQGRWARRASVHNAYQSVAHMRRMAEQQAEAKDWHRAQLAQPQAMKQFYSHQLTAEQRSLACKRQDRATPDANGDN